jgi:hypothetical protein
MVPSRRSHARGPSRAAALPRETGSEADRVGVRRGEPAVVGKRAFEDVSEWFAELDRLALDPFMPEGRQQPPTPQPKVQRLGRR